MYRPRALRSTLFALACVLLLLVAQQGALTHAIWHAHQTKTTHSPSAIDKHQTPAGQASLCAFDLAFGQVLGSAHGSGATLTVIAADIERIHDVPAARLHAEALSPKSRGPPVLA